MEVSEFWCRSQTKLTIPNCSESPLTLYTDRTTRRRYSGAVLPPSPLRYSDGEHSNVERNGRGFELYYDDGSGSGYGNCRPSFFPSQFSRNPDHFLLRPFTVPVFTRSSTPRLRVSSTAFVETQPTGPVVEGKEESRGANVLACPICYDPLTRTGDSPLCVGSTSGSKLQCNTCKKVYFGNETHLDLVASSGSKQYDESMPLATEIFRTPVVSFLYERGWRQNFIFGGFPGPEKDAR